MLSKHLWSTINFFFYHFNELPWWFSFYWHLIQISYVSYERVNTQRWHTIHIFINIDILHIWSASHRASTLQVKTSSSNFISIALHSYMCGTGLTYAPFVFLLFFCVFILLKMISFVVVRMFHSIYGIFFFSFANFMVKFIF